MNNKKCFSVYLFLISVFLLIQANSCKKDSDDLQEDIPLPAVFNPNLTYGTMTDQEGHVYKTIKIGDYTWMAENLQTTKYNDGTDIPEVESYQEWFNISTPGNSAPAFCWYGTDIVYKATYGALYNAHAVNTGKLAPVGWHVATIDEWTSLIENLGSTKNAGYKLKETGTVHWSDTDEKTDNGSGFTALPGGYRGSSEFGGMGEYGYWWGSSPSEANNNSVFKIQAKFSIVYLTSGSNISAYSVRCVKDK